MIHRKLILLVLFAGSGLAVPAVAQEQPADGAATGSAPAPAARSERRICRSETETGSLARRRRRCFTAAEWDRLATGARIAAERDIDANRGRPGGQ